MKGFRSQSRYHRSRTVTSGLSLPASTILNSLSIDPAEIAQFDRLLKEDIYFLPEEKISSDGYVIHTLEASIWSFMTTDNYKDSVLKAINLGGDTDTTGAVTGGLAGLYYGYENIPIRWINAIARREEIEELAGRVGEKLF